MPISDRWFLAQLCEVLAALAGLPGEPRGGPFWHHLFAAYLQQCPLEGSVAPSYTSKLSYLRSLIRFRRKHAPRESGNEQRPPDYIFGTGGRSIYGTRGLFLNLTFRLVREDASGHLLNV